VPAPSGGLVECDRRDRIDLFAVAGEREQVVDEGVHPVERRRHAVEMLVVGCLSDDVEPSGRDVQRVPEVVAHDAHEVVEPLVAPFEFLLSSHPLGHVPDDADGADPLAVFVPRRDPRLTGDRRPVGGVERPRERTGRPLLVGPLAKLAFDRLASGLDVVGRHDEVDVAPDEFLARVAGDLLGGVVDERESTLGVEAVHHVAGGVDHPLVPFEFALSLLPVADVADDPRDAAVLVVLVWQQRDVVLVHRLLPVGSLNGDLVRPAARVRLVGEQTPDGRLGSLGRFLVQHGRGL